jgi:ribulose-5-phosphate 4-epimerase/fuculose-1-phosphate aldolase
MDIATLDAPATDMVEARRAARIDLAAAMRVAVWYGYHEAIDNHFTLTMPGQPDRFYLNPYGLHWAEMRASDFLEVDHGGTVRAGTGIADQTAVCIHGPVHRLVPGANCVLHSHMPFATALTQLEDMTVEMIGQTALGFAGDIAYDYEYDGLAHSMADGERLAALMGDKPIAMMANHGVLVTGPTVADAFALLYFLERVCQTQVYAQWTGKKRRFVPDTVVTKTRRQYNEWSLPDGVTASGLHFAALKRLLDRREPDYAT